MKKVYFESEEARADWLKKKHKKLEMALDIKKSGVKIGLWNGETIDASILRLEAQIENCAKNSRIVSRIKGYPNIAERRKIQNQLKAAESRAIPVHPKVSYFETAAQNEVKLGLLERMQKDVPLGYEAFRTALKLLKLWNQ